MLRMEEAAELIQSKKISPVELTQACLKRIRALQPSLNAFVYIMEEKAMESAKQAEAEIMAGRYRGRMHGIPIALKDLYYTQDAPTTAGSEILRGFYSGYDATVTKRLREAGAILLGKTNTHEFAFGPTGEESCFGPCRNPWNPQKISGGSSSGSGVAAATGMAFVAMGTDTGGSVRIPASMCGVVGFKPSIGVLSLYGVIALSFSVDHPGPLCRSVADAAIAMDALTGTDPLDPCPHAAVQEKSDYYAQIRDVRDLKGRVVGVPKNFFFDKVDYEVERLFHDAMARLVSLGAQIREVEIPALELLVDASTYLIFSEVLYLHRDWWPAKRELYQAGVAERLERAGAFKATDYIRAVKDREKIMRAWEESVKGLDAVAVPTCPIEAFDLGLGLPWNIEVRGKTEPGRVMCTLHTRLANMTGGPALSVPAGLTKNGLPAGLMLMGPRGGDLGILRMGLAYERSYAFPVLRFDE